MAATRLRIFISSVQKEFAHERAALRDYLRGDALMRRFFEPFLFEDVPAADRRADELYLDEVGRCDLYLGLFGNDYGFEDAAGLSPTQREFDLATECRKHRLIFVMGTGTGDMIERCRKAGLPEPEFALTDGFIITLRRKPELAFAAVGGEVAGQVAPPVTPPVAGEVAGQVAGQDTGQVTGQVVEEVRRVVLVLHGEKSRKHLQEALCLKGRANFEERYLKPAVEAGLVEPTLPNKPNSRLQKYRLTLKGRTWLKAAGAKSPPS